MRREEIARLRLRNQRLTSAPLPSAAEVVRWLGAVQAQEYIPAKWSIGLRARGVTEAMVDEALAAGTILRTHLLRPTWHFVAARDIGWVLAATAARVVARMAPYDRHLELDEATFTRCLTAIGRALAGGRHRTRAQLAAALGEAGIAASGQRLAHIMLRAEVEGLVCSGAPSGKVQTYALLEERAPQRLRMTRGEAVAELTRRFFVSHGPATVRDYCWWSSLIAGEAHRAIEALGGELERLEADGRAYWYAPRAVAGPGAPAPASLLPAYDEYIIPYRESKDVFDIERLAATVPGRATTFSHAVALGGQVVGHWRRVERGKALAVEVWLARALTDDERRRLERAVARYGAFSGRPAALVVRSGPRARRAGA
jgi:hypothetical protein